MHEPLMGQVKYGGKWVARSRLAQEYPKPLVNAMIAGFLEDREQRKQSEVMHCVFTIESLGLENEKKLATMIRRCHENLGHPSKARFISMLKAARANEKCLQIAKGLKCSTCDAVQKPLSHPVSKSVGSGRFNDLVCVDTFEVELPWRKVKMLNIVDAASRYQICVPMWKGIEVSRIRQAYRRHWKRWAGPPKRLLSDGGSEFSLDWTDALSRDGTHHEVTAAWAPWQNGLCERHGGSWKEAFQKAILEVEPGSRHEAEEVMDQITTAHNTLVRVEGHSPTQIVLGQDVRVPGLEGVEPGEHMESGLLEGENMFEHVLRVRTAARKAMIEASDQDRVRRAVQHRTRPIRGPYEPGELIMLWRKGRNEKKAHWHGPGRAIGTHHGKVFVAYGNKVYRCAPEQVRKVHQDVALLSQWLPDQLRQWRDTIRERGAGNVVELDLREKPPVESEVEGRDIPPNPFAPEPQGVDVDGDGDVVMGNPEEFEGGNNHAEQDELMQDGVGNQHIGEQDGMGEQGDVVMDAEEPQRPPSVSSRGRSVVEPQQEPEAAQASGSGQTSVQATNTANSGYGPIRVTPLGRAMRHSLDTLDFGRIRDTPNPEDTMVAEYYWDHARVGHEEVYVANVKKMSRKEVCAKDLDPARMQELQQAKAKEWSKMISSKAVRVHSGAAAREIMEKAGDGRILESRFVYTTEQGLQHGALKARWCIRGYLDPDLMDLETSAPTLSMEGFAVVTQLLASHRWRMAIGDIEAAFLRGDNMNRSTGVVLVRVPRDGIPGLNKDDVIELVKPVYGLADAPRLWWQSLTKTLVEIGMVQSKLDGCVFYKRNDHGELLGTIAFHVDDLLVGGTLEFYDGVFSELQRRYPFKHVKHDEGEFLGKYIRQLADGTLVIQQRGYAENISSIVISKERRRERDHDTTDMEKGQMRAVLGEINWLVSGTRPDLAAACSLMQQRVTKSTVQDMIELNKVVAVARDFAAVEIKVLPIPMLDLELAAWSDASFANAEEKKSQGGYMICAVDRKLRANDWGRVSPLRWRSFKQERQVASTLGAELLTLSRTIAEAKWIRSMITEAMYPWYTLESDKERSSRMPITIAIDSKPAFDHLNGQVLSIKDKRLAIEMLLVRQDVERENVQVRWLPTDHMVVDGLTKLNAPMALLRRVLKEGKMILVENEEVMRWIGKVPRRA